MVSPVSAPASEVELPKPALKSSSPAKDSVPVPAERETLAYVHGHEDISMRMTNKDGDVFEVRGTWDYEAAFYSSQKYGVTKAQARDGVDPEGKQDGTEGAKSADGEDKAKLDRMAAWAKGVVDELRKQQLALLTKALKDFKPTDAGDGRYIMVFGAVYESSSGSGSDPTDPDSIDPAAPADDGGEAKVPEFWNAENTSQRIVSFAVGFAALHGQDPEGFAQTIKQAIADGFDQAHAQTGDLPGAAGRLFKDTKDLVFAKLDKWLEDWKAAGYNQTAPQTENVPEAVA